MNATLAHRPRPGQYYDPVVHDRFAALGCPGNLNPRWFGADVIMRGRCQLDGAKMRPWEFMIFISNRWGDLRRARPDLFIGHSASNEGMRVFDLALADEVERVILQSKEGTQS